MKPRTRREFIRQSTGIAAAAGILGSNPGVSRAQSATSGDRIRGANDRIRVGVIGCGGQGRANLRAMLRIKNIECVALCDVDDEQTARMIKMVEDQGAGRPAISEK
jgi:ornithine cyclodeaminase/alanine dehydrogenase-like protein (mu-crystallin family)